MCTLWKLMDILLVFYSQSCHCMHIKRNGKSTAPEEIISISFLLIWLFLQFLFPFPEKCIRLFWTGWLLCALCTGHPPVQSLLHRLMLKSLWFYAMIRHTTVAEHTGTHFLLQTNTHWALPTTSGEPVLAYCFFCCFSGYFTEGMRTNQLQTCRGKAHKF